ncbi:Exo endo phos 2 domain containing protein, partial [Asbolus verrucosus]
KLKTTDKLKLKNYNIIRQDRPGDIAAGGVAILIKTNIPYTVLKPITTDLETAALQLASSLTIIAAYNRPANRINVNDLDRLITKYNKFIITGDFNAKHPNWGCDRYNTNGHILQTYTQTNDLIIHSPPTPTHFPPNGSTPTTIDLVLTHNVRSITPPKTLHELNSDHLPVIFQINKQIKENHQIKITSYSQTNWIHFRQDIDNKITINKNIDTTDKLEHETQKLITLLQKIKNKHTITKTINANRDKIPNNIVQIIKFRNSTRKQYQKTRRPELLNNINTLNTQ